MSLADHVGPASSNLALRNRISIALGALPRGNALPADVWLGRHRVILGLVWVQALALFVFGLVQGSAVPGSLMDAGLIVVAPAITELLGIRNRTFRSTATSFGLVTSSAVLTHLSGGYIEAHFHFFVMLAVIALYQSWMPFLVSIVYVLIHHGVGGIVEPTSVFNHPDGIAHPWKWAAIHAAFVSSACATYLVAWRWNEIAQSRTENILEAAGEGIIGLDGGGRILFVNPAAERIAGATSGTLLGKHLTGMIDLPNGVTGGHAGLTDDSLEPEVTEGTLRRRGIDLPIELMRTAINDRNRVTGEVVTIRDITARKKAEQALRESEERFRSLVQNASDLITVIDSDTTIRYQSPSIQRVLGYSADEMLGAKLVDVLHADDVAKVLTFLSESMTRPNRTATVEARVRHLDGSWLDLEIIGTDQRADVAVAGFVLNIRDVTERKELERQLRHQAFYDALTDLGNRASFFERLEHALLRVSDHGGRLALIYLDLDDFKSVNDRFGHGAGDQFLIEVAQRLKSCVKPADTAARLGGDEFAILLEDVVDEDYPGVVSEKLLQALRRPYALEGHEFNIDASIGIALTSGDESNSNLLRNADIAMYESKRNGGSRYTQYSRQLHTAAMERLELLSDLQQALSRGEFEVFYQPTVLLQSGSIVGFEALIRWNHPRHGLLFPDSFIRLAEESGMIRPMGRWILTQACKQAKAWNTDFVADRPLTMNVNVSVKQLQHPSFAAEVREALQLSGLAPSCLVLEITESVMMHNSPAMISRLNELKALGVRLAIDDFGTGYSSLSYLPQFPFDILKIDKAFIESQQDSGQREVTRTIIELGKTLSLDIVAEGIEHLEQLVALRSLDCEFGQGFYFSQPVQAGEISSLLASRARGEEAA